MQRRRIATGTLVPAVALTALGAVPATAGALPSGKHPPKRITRAQWEGGLFNTNGGGVKPDLCYYECGGSWGAYSHAVTDAFNHGGYSELAGVNCYDENPPAKRGQEQWLCGGSGKYGGKWWGWEVYLSPYGYSLSGSHYPN
jgi:hypothetical protein